MMDSSLRWVRAGCVEINCNAMEGSNGRERKAKPSSAPDRHKGFVQRQNNTALFVALLQHHHIHCVMLMQISIHSAALQRGTAYVLSIDRLAEFC